MHHLLGDFPTWPQVISGTFEHHPKIPDIATRFREVAEMEA
jgi:hypothetical protein